jgi:BASS family bile acid:Na+ symporter
VFDHYEQYEHTIASLQLFLAMLGMGALLSPADYISQLRQPKSLSLGLVLQWLLLPLLAMAIGYVLNPPAGIAAGLLLVTIVPTGVTGNVLTYFGRGNIALSVSITAITTVCALFTVPIFLHLFLQPYLPENFQLPLGQIMRDIVFNLAIPLALGMWIKDKVAFSSSEKISRWLIRASLALIVVMGFGAASTGRMDPQAYGMAGIVVISVFCLGIFLMALMLSRLLKISPADRLALMIKTNYRNISLAIAIKSVLFPSVAGQLDPIGDGVFFTILLYGGISLVTSVLVMLWHRYTYRS